jgi:hypothetical protein
MQDSMVENKVCNFLIPDARATPHLYSSFANLPGMHSKERVLTLFSQRFRAIYGGLWVGGTATLNAVQLSFVPNAMNQLMHEADYSLSIPLRDIAHLQYEFGLLSGVIHLHTRGGLMKLRCFGARGFLSRIAAAAAAAESNHTDAVPPASAM